MKFRERLLIIFPPYLFTHLNEILIFALFNSFLFSVRKFSLDFIAEVFLSIRRSDLPALPVLVHR